MYYQQSLLVTDYGHQVCTIGAYKEEQADESFETHKYTWGDLKCIHDSDGQIKITIWFKSWLNHVFIWFEYKIFDLDLISIDVI